MSVGEGTVHVEPGVQKIKFADRQRSCQRRAGMGQGEARPLPLPRRRVDETR